MSLNKEHIQEIVAQAMFSPSGDNSQPWIFQWDGTTLNVIHQESRASHPLNPAGIASMISVGCVLETIAIAVVLSRWKIFRPVIPRGLGLGSALQRVLWTLCLK
jgi:hypothetical protein